jgi:hypothetical protein
MLPPDVLDPKSERNNDENDKMLNKKNGRCGRKKQAARGLT